MQQFPTKLTQSNQMASLPRLRYSRQEGLNNVNSDDQDSNELNHFFQFNVFHLKPLSNVPRSCYFKQLLESKLSRYRLFDTDRRE